MSAQESLNLEDSLHPSMTISNHEMNDEEQNHFFDAIDRVNKAGSALRMIFGALSAMAIAGLSVAAWVWMVNQVQNDHAQSLNDIKPRISNLETWKTKVEAIPTPTVSQLHELDKRLSTVETRLISIYEQNSIILETLKAIERKP